MYYEFILKVRGSQYEPFDIKYRCVCPEKDYDWVNQKYLREELKDPMNRVVLVNKFDDNMDFIGVLR